MTDDHPAISGKQVYSKKGPLIVEPNEENYKFYARHFPGISLESTKRTFKATTQYGRKGAFPGLHMKHRIKAPNPALNVPRRNEAVATDTIYGPKKTPAVDDGSTAAQFFIGRTSKYRDIKGCGHSDKGFHKILYDYVRTLGAMDVLISDRAKAEVGKNVQELLRSLFTRDRQSEPYNKNQNFTERGWQDTQVKYENVMNWSGATMECWLLALTYVCFVMNRVAIEGLNWRTPFEWLHGKTPDITILFWFLFYEPVYYSVEDTPKSETDEAMGRFVGFSESVGHGMTFMILTNEKKIIHRSLVRSANKEGAYDNFRARMAADKIRPARSLMESRKDLIRKKDAVRETVVPETVEDEDDKEDRTDPDAQPIPSLLRTEPRKQKSKTERRKWNKDLEAKHAQSKPNRRKSKQ